MQDDIYKGLKELRENEFEALETFKLTAVFLDEIKTRMQEKGNTNHELYEMCVMLIPKIRTLELHHNDMLQRLAKMVRFGFE